MKKTLLLGSILAVFISVNAWANGETEYMKSSDGKIYKKVYVKKNNPTNYEYRTQDDKSKQQPDIRPYISAKLKSTSTDTEGDGETLVDDHSFGGSIAFGMSFKLPKGGIRTELELNKNAEAKTLQAVYDDTSITTAVKTQSIMMNAYYDFDTGTLISPYVGAGIGYARVKGKAYVSNYYNNSELAASVSNNNLAWQVGAGLSVDMAKNIAFDTGYRYIDYGNFTDDDVKIDTSAHEVYAGLRFMF